MKILLISPCGFPATPAMKYGGIERLVLQYSAELIKDHEVSIVALKGEYPQLVNCLSIEDSLIGEDLNEIRLYQLFSGRYRDFDVIHDFSHLHIATRFIPLPSLNVFWHAPALAKYAKAPYNIISISDWGRWEFERIYGYKARYQETVVVDTSTHVYSNKRGDRLLTLGIMQPNKGNLEAAQLCKQLNLPLDIAGSRGMGVNADTPLSDYEKEIMKLCDGKQIRFLGEVDETTKIQLMQSARALLYIAQTPEVHSHKCAEAICCGCPIIVTDIGAFGEVVEHNQTGFLVTNYDQIPNFIKKVDSLYKNKEQFKKASDKWNIQKVVSDYIPLYEEVRNGLKW